MASQALPPVDGSIPLLPGFVDFHAKHNPERPWVVFPSFEDPSKASVITFSELANATHRIAHLARPGRAGPEGSAVGLLINCDTILYVALIHGLLRAGIVPVPISPRNSPEAVANLLLTTHAVRLISQPALLSLATTTQSQLAEKGYQVAIENLYSIYDVFPTLKSENKNDVLAEGLYPERQTPLDPNEPVIVLHSSGSTGLPKPVFLTYKILLQWTQSEFATADRKRALRWASGGLPTFHTIGMGLQALDPLTTGQPAGMFTPQEPLPPVIPTADKVLELSRVTKSNAIISVPTFLEAWAQSEEATKYLATLVMVGFGGGPLSLTSGEKLVKAGVTLQSNYGTTETGFNTGHCDTVEFGRAVEKTKDDWYWLSFPPQYHIRWVPQDDASFELQFLTCETHQPAVENLPDVKGYSTRDLFLPHPTKKGLWRVVGRLDDVIVLGTGEKIVPIKQEGHMTANTIIAGAVMFGREKMQPGVLIEPYPEHAVNPKNEASLAEFRNKVWPIVAEANGMAPTFAKVFKEMIVVTDPHKPLPRAAKGTVIRKQALALYAEEIDNAYKAVEDSTVKYAGGPVSWSEADVQSWLLDQAEALNDGVSRDITHDLFEQGFDSLSATFLRNHIITALRNSSDQEVSQAASKVSQNFVFDNPTIARLTSAILALNSGTNVGRSRTEHIIELIDRYTADLPVPKHAPVANHARGRVVLLTGSTGNIGAHILAHLLRDKHVAKVFTLNRHSSAGTPLERLYKAFEQRGLPIELLEGSRIEALAGDLNDDLFGLSKETFDKIRSSLTHAMLNGWMVDFNHSLDSFEHQISGTRKVLDFCAELPQPVTIMFTSSISVATKWDVTAGPVPEQPIEDPEVASASGYSASKYVTEQILSKAADKGMSTISLRVGQVSGSATTGAWNTTDWVPILVKSSLALGALPALPGPISWIPVDAVAGIVRDIVVSEEPVPKTVNVSHPQPVLWDEVFKLLNDALDANLPMIPYAQWLEKVEALSRDPTPKTLDDVPAIKLLEFFRALQIPRQPDVAVEAGGFPLFQTSQLQQLSETARTLPPLSIEHTRAWVSYWKEQGLFKYSGEAVETV